VRSLVEICTFTNVHSSVDNAEDTTRLTLDIILAQALKDNIQHNVLAYGIKTLTKPESHVNKDIVVVLPSKPSQYVTAVAAELEAALVTKGSRVHTVTWPAPIPAFETSPEIVSMLEFDDLLISKMSSTDFKLLKALVFSGKRLLWVVKGRDPILQTASGFLRSLSNENAGVEYCFLHLGETGERSYQSISNTVEQLLSHGDLEREYKEVDGMICCSRWSERQDLSALVGAGDVSSQKTFLSLGRTRGAFNLINGKNDAGSKSVFTEEVSNCNILESEVEIEVRSLLLKQVSQLPTTPCPCSY